MDPEEYRKKLELDIIKIIQEKLQNGEMQPERAQAIARMVLENVILTSNMFCHKINQ